METQSSTPVLTEAEKVSSPVTSPDVKAEKAQLKAVLAEARNTREVLIDFKNAIERGQFDGISMMPLAKGQAFLDAILAQNQGHIKNLQERLDA